MSHAWPGNLKGSPKQMVSAELKPLFWKISERGFPLCQPIFYNVHTAPICYFICTVIVLRMLERDFQAAPTPDGTYLYLFWKLFDLHFPCKLQCSHTLNYKQQYPFKGP